MPYSLKRTHLEEFPPVEEVEDEAAVQGLNQGE